MKIEVVPHDPEWAADFQVESERLAVALASNAFAIHHIGSTSIPGIFAKPIIDVLVEAANLDEVDSRHTEMESLGYEVMGEFGIPGRRYFRKDDANGVRTHQVHVFQSGSPQIARHLAFRDYMISHPKDAQDYSNLKCELAKQFPFDAEAYMDGKDAFIQEIDRLAAVWRNRK